MKALKTLAAIGLLSLSAAGAGFASVTSSTVYYITGSTAFRAATMTALGHLLNNGYSATWYGGTSLTGCSDAIYSGTLVSNSDPVEFKVAWSGSIGGVQTVSQKIATSFLADSDLTTYGTTYTNNANGTAPTGAGGSSAGQDTAGNLTDSETPTICLSDVFQASTPYPTPTLVTREVGVIPFEWVASYGSPTSTLTNMTPQLARLLYTSGSIPLALFTGLSSDEGTQIYGLGRDADSGTRLTALAETGVGVFTTLQQEFPLDSNGNIIGNISGATGNPGPVSSFELTPPETVNNINYAQGNGGYSSGGNLAYAMRASSSSSIGYAVAYLGTSDTATATSTGTNGGNAHALTYDGVPYSSTAIIEGQYTFWGYEHLDNINSGDTTFCNSLATQIEAGDATLSGILLSSMRVARQTDGGTVADTKF